MRGLRRHRHDGFYITLCRLICTTRRPPAAEDLGSGGSNLAPDVGPCHWSCARGSVWMMGVHRLERPGAVAPAPAERDWPQTTKNCYAQHVCASGRTNLPSHLACPASSGIRIDSTRRFPPETWAVSYTLTAPTDDTIPSTAGTESAKHSSDHGLARSSQTSAASRAGHRARISTRLFIGRKRSTCRPTCYGSTCQGSPDCHTDLAAHRIPLLQQITPRSELERTKRTT